MLHLVTMALGAASIGGLSFTANPVQAQQFPEKPVRLVVPQAAGSASDNIARMLAIDLSRALGQPVIVDNRPGGSFVIGMDFVAKAPPDGYTIGLGVVGAVAISPNMLSSAPYDILRDFQPIGLIGTNHLLLAVAPNSPFKTVAELVEFAKKNPGRLMNASSSNGSPGHVSAEIFKQMTGTQIVHVPYKGGAAAINDLVAGHVHLMFESMNSIAPHAKSGKVRALAVSGPKRSPVLPDTPTVAEAGVAGYNVMSWSGVVGPANLPRPVLARLNSALNTAITSPTFRERYALIGEEPIAGTPEQFGAFIRSELAKWGDAIRRAGAKLD